VVSQIKKKNRVHYSIFVKTSRAQFNPLNADLNPICPLLILLGAHPILYVSRIGVNET